MGAIGVKGHSFHRKFWLAGPYMYELVLL